MVAAKLKSYFAELAKERQKELGRTHGDPLKENFPEGVGQARDHAAAKFGVCGKTVDDAERNLRRRPMRSPALSRALPSSRCGTFSTTGDTSPFRKFAICRLFACSLRCFRNVFLKLSLRLAFFPFRNVFLNGARLTLSRACPDATDREGSGTFSLPLK
jgi:hypothetical protein